MLSFISFSLGIVIMSLLIIVVLPSNFFPISKPKSSKFSSPFFFLQKQYWYRLAQEAQDKANVIHSPKLHSASHENVNYQNINVENSIEDERERVLKNHQLGAECKGLRIIGMNKIHRRSVLGFASSKDVHAVKDAYLEVDDGELLSLLGHNGAGILIFQFICVNSHFQ